MLTPGVDSKDSTDKKRKTTGKSKKQIKRQKPSSPVFQDLATPELQPSSLFLGLPSEIIEYILHYLTIPDLANATSTCKQLHVRHGSNSLWKLHFESYTTSRFHAFQHTIFFPTNPGEEKKINYRESTKEIAKWKFREEVFKALPEKFTHLTNMKDSNRIRTDDIFLDFLLTNLTMDELHQTDFDRFLNLNDFINQFLKQFNDDKFITTYFIDLPNGLSKNGLAIYWKRMHDAYTFISDHMERSTLTLESAPQIPQIYNSRLQAILFNESDALLKPVKYPLTTYGCPDYFYALMLNRVEMARDLIESGLKLWIPRHFSNQAAKNNYYELFGFILDLIRKNPDSTSEASAIWEMIENAFKHQDHQTLHYLYLYLAEDKSIDIRDDFKIIMHVNFDGWQATMEKAVVDNHIDFLKAMEIQLRAVPNKYLKNLVLQAKKHGHHELCTYILNLAFFKASTLRDTFLSGDNEMDSHYTERQILAWDYILASKASTGNFDVSNIETTINLNWRSILLKAGQLKCYSLVDALLATFALEKEELSYLNGFMHHAARDNDVAMIKILIKHGYEINSVYPEQTPFYQGIDHLVMIEITTLLANGAKQTPLFVAISANALHAVTTLVENGAQLDNTLFKLALSCHNTKIAAYLYEQLIGISDTHPLSIEEQTYYLSHAMDNAHNDSLIRFLISIRTERFEEKQINELLSHKKDYHLYNFISLFEALEEKGDKPQAALLLHEAIQAYDLGVVKYLLHRGEVVNDADWEFAQKDQRLLNLLRECSKVAAPKMEEPSHIAPSMG